MDFDLYAYKDYRTNPKTKRREWRGTWFYVILLPADADGRRPQRKQRGFATKGDALEAGRKKLAQFHADYAADAKRPPGTGPVKPVTLGLAEGATRATAQAESMTVEEYLEG